MDNTLYILTRTSGRPVFFSLLRKSIEALTWPHGIIHIVHTDDPRDTYVEGDIIVRGESLFDRKVPHPLSSGQYNYYNNRLLDVIPGDGWVHFIDDDDEYAAPDVFERMLHNPDPTKVIIGHVQRGGETLIPPGWGFQKSFQTEIPIMRVDVARSSRWPLCKSGDHIYTEPIVARYGCQWVDNVVIATSREGKGRGRRRDIGGTSTAHNLPLDTIVYTKPGPDHEWEPRYTTFKEAEEMQGYITYEGVRADYVSVELPSTPVEFDSDLSAYESISVTCASHMDSVMKRSMSFKRNGTRNREFWSKRSLWLYARENENRRGA